jgi:flavin-dependent dehydrogenase
LTPDDSYDVAIVGAGLAGLECARRLCEAGLRVLFVDRKPDISRSVHTTGIFVRRTLEEFDLPESCLGPPIRHVVLHSPARRPLPLEVPPHEFRIGLLEATCVGYLVDLV